MRTVLGLDAGGTFTDSVVIDAGTSEVLYKAKTSTTPNNLLLCLETAFSAVPLGLMRSVSMVCLSTTLATNAVVEERGCREGVVLIGGVPRGALPTPRQVVVQGRYDMKGRLIEHLDPAQVRAAVESLRGRVDAVAVSGYASVRNPDHELFVKAVVEDVLGVPVVCAHEMTSQLGYYDRTVTAVLNASLIPLVRELTNSVTQVMSRFGVDAPLMMVRGDGTLMAEGVAHAKPIETILSGPAASAIGAVHLSGRSDCLVVDIGGTTTDVAHVRGGELVIRADGARIGDWRTQVRAAEVLTVGLGGDSRIYVDDTRRLRVGPARSVSYSLAGLQYPHLIDELEAIASSPWSDELSLPQHEAYILGRSDASERTHDRKVVLDVLAERPHTLSVLARTTGLPGLPAVLSELVREGAVQRISLTPTDLWHVTGDYQPGSVRAAELGLQISAKQLGLRPDEFVELMRRTLDDQTDIVVLQAARDASAIPRDSEEIGLPVVAIGGPAKTWWPNTGAAPLFGREVPAHAEVANAIGAAVAHAVESVDVLIRKDSVTDRYLVFSPQGRLTSPTLEEATEVAVASGGLFLEKVLGQEIVDLESRISDVELSGVGRSGDAFVERVVRLRARPRF